MEQYQDDSYYRKQGVFCFLYTDERLKLWNQDFTNQELHNNYLLGRFLCTLSTSADMQQTIEAWLFTISNIREDVRQLFREFFEQAYNSGLKEFKGLAEFFREYCDFYRLVGIQGAKRWYELNYPPVSYNPFFDETSADIMESIEQGMKAYVTEEEYLETKLKNLFR